MGDNKQQFSNVVHQKNTVGVTLDTSTLESDLQGTLDLLDLVSGVNMENISPQLITQYIEEPELQVLIDKEVFMYDFDCCMPKKCNHDAICEFLSGAYLGWNSVNQSKPTSVSMRAGLRYQHLRPKYTNLASSRPLSRSSYSSTSS